MSRKGTDRQDFKEFYPDSKLVDYLIHQLWGADSREVTGADVRLMKKDDFYAFWGSEAINVRDGVYAYFGDSVQPWGCAFRDGGISMTYCFAGQEEDEEVARRLGGLRKKSALMLDVSSR